MSGLLTRLEGFGERVALIWRDQALSYDALCAQARAVHLPEDARCLALLADYGPAGLAGLLAALDDRRIVAPITPALAPDPRPLLELVDAQAALVDDGQRDLQVRLRPLGPEGWATPGALPAPPAGDAPVEPAPKAQATPGPLPAPPAADAPLEPASEAQATPGALPAPPAGDAPIEPAPEAQATPGPLPTPPAPGGPGCAPAASPAAPAGDDGVVNLTCNETAPARPLRPPLLRQLSEVGGLVLFTSGSAGRIKAVVHHGPRFLARYQRPGRPNRVIPFMLFDHVGGVNTALSVLSAGGCLVIAEDRSPEAICRLIARHRVQALPTTPTFLRLLLLSGLHQRHDLSSLEILAYGAERMPEALLARLAEALPGRRLLQNYGMSELGILRTRSEASGSPWIRIEGPELRVRDGQLEVRADGVMLGYLNEASPFTEDGWLRTGDRVERRGPLLRILGRASDLIIVGGEKVYPAEVEDAIAQLEGVVEVVVAGEAHPLTGQLVKATVRLAQPEDKAAFRRRMRAQLRGQLAAYKIPQKIQLTQDSLQSTRLKQRRR